MRDTIECLVRQLDVFLLSVFLSELGRRHALLSLEGAVKMLQRLIADDLADLINRDIALKKEPAGHLHSVGCENLRERMAGLPADKTTEVCGAVAEGIGSFLERCICKTFMQILIYPVSNILLPLLEIIIGIAEEQRKETDHQTLFNHLVIVAVAVVFEEHTLNAFPDFRILAAGEIEVRRSVLPAQHALKEVRQQVVIGEYIEKGCLECALLQHDIQHDAVV